MGVTFLFRHLWSLRNRPRHILNQCLDFRVHYNLLPAHLIVKVLDRLERQADRDFEEVYEEGKPIVPQMKNWAKAEGFELKVDWKVQLAHGVKEKLHANPDKYIDEAQLASWTTMFQRII